MNGLGSNQKVIVKSIKLTSKDQIKAGINLG